MNKRNDSERAEWVQNDEGLYRWWKGERGSLRDFIKAHRSEIDLCIDAVTGATKPAHFLAYGGGL